MILPIYHYCHGELAEVVPVFLAELGPNGRLRRAAKVPLYWRCTGCGEIVPAPVTDGPLTRPRAEEVA